MKTRKSWLLLIALIALFLRTYRLKELPPGLFADEAMNGNNIMHALRTGAWSVFYPENMGREGLFINIQGLFVKLLGNKPWVLRTPSVLFGTLTVIGLYFLTKELFRSGKGLKEDDAETVSLLAAFFTATSFWHINFSRIGFRAISAPFWIVWALYFLFLGYRSLRESASDSPTPVYCAPRTILYFIIGGLTFGTGIHSYIAYRAMPAVILVVFLYYFLIARKDGWVRRFLVALGTYVFFSILAAAPLLYYFAVHPGSFLERASQVAITAGGGHELRNLARGIVKTLGMFNVMGDLNWRHNFERRPEIFWPVGICFIVGVALTIRYLLMAAGGEKAADVKSASITPAVSSFLSRIFSENKLPYATIISLSAMAALPVVISKEGLPHALRSVLLIPPAFMFAGFGAFKIYQFTQELFSRFMSPASCRLSRLAFLAILALLCVEAYTTYFILWGKNPNVPAEFDAEDVVLGKEINALPTSPPKYIVVKAGGVFVNGIPISSQTVMFITDTYDKKQQDEKNIHYVLRGDESKIPRSALKFYIR